MGSDFYKRSRELFEEFQKRELHYLNTQSIYSDQLHITSDSSLPVQEYLQKLNKREKESEDTYRGLMAHMEQLDRRTESIQAKLEKLNSLKTSMSLRFPTWSSSSNNYDQQYPNYSHTSNIFQAHQDLNYSSALKTNQDFPFPTTKVTQIKDIKSATTQTDHMFCENCHFPITFSSGVLKASCSLSTIPESSTPLLQKTISFTKADECQTLNPSTDFIHQSTNLEENTSQTIVQPNECIDQSILAFNNENLKLISPIPQIPIIGTNENEIDSHVIFDKQDNRSSMNEKNAETVVLNKTIIASAKESDLIDEKNPSIDDTISLSDGVDKIISKSDDESLNHEFDFLDSDKRSQRRSVQTKQDLLPQASKSATNSLTSTQEFVKNDQSNNKIDKGNLLQPSENAIKNPSSNLKNAFEFDDKQSESSISIEGARSPSLRSENLSAVSDSDSLYEKEDPHIKTSAAYQALLGNAPIAKSVQQLPYSESESEDEIEKALANNTKKPRKVSINSASQDEKAQDIKKVVPESKPKMEPRKSISGGKSQQLSKTTRKVLGLDTSSGSEGEVKLEANVKKKIEEDSDEFDFYD